MIIETVTCPSQPRYEGDLTGCGITFNQGLADHFRKAVDGRMSREGTCNAN